jgi:mRNA-degrading endonuclease toxin of MazEF toxin-antitoxin module
MKAFDVYHWQPSGWPEPHPCVVISHPGRAVNKDPVEVVMCSTKRTTRQPQVHEVILDEADGMDWPTLCKCDLIHTVPKSELKKHKGSVSEKRRALLVRTIIAAHGWPEVLVMAG